MQVVERFGARMKMVSTLAPERTAAGAVRNAYADLVTPALLDRWSADPSHAPGKDVSSPWPDRIRIDSTEAVGTGACRVTGAIVYVTSAEVASGGVASLTPVTLRVVSDGGWRISAFDTAPVVPDSALAAADVIRRYYAAIDARDYRQAYALWGNGGAASSQTFEQFRAGFANTVHVEVAIGEVGQVEGAAGSRYVDVPVVVRATTKEGEAQRFEGSYTLRRTVVDGSTDAQRRWHIYSAKLAQTR
jgi:hypothetical protein